MLEPASTNLVTYSEDFSNAYWTKSGLGVTSGFISPDGTLNAYKMVKDTNTGTGFLRASGFSQLATENITLSIYAKAGENNSVILYEDYSDDGVIFNLKTGTITAYRGTPVSSSMELLTNGFYKLNLTVFPNYTISQYKVIAIDNSGSLTAAGDGTSGVYIFGAQLEVLSYATSYIPTLSGAIQTRAAESCDLTPPSGVIGQAEGTVYWEINVKTTVASGNENILNIDAGAFGNTIYFIKSASGNLVGEMFTSSSLQASFTKIAITEGVHKMAMGYANNNTAFFVDGTQIGTTDTSCTVPTTNRIQLGNGVLGSSDCLLNDLRLYKTRLTNAQLQTLTTI